MSFFIISLKNSLVYRSSVIFNIIGSIFWVLISIALWSFIYQNDTQMISYMTAYVILSSIISMFYSGGMSDAIGRKVISGEFAIDLIRPVNFIGMNYAQVLGGIISSLILRGLPTMLLFLPMLIKNAKFNSPIIIIASIAAVVLGHFLYVLIYSLIGFMAFILIEIWPFNRLMNDTIRFLSGAFIPLALFPGWLKILSDVLPFKFLYSFPLELILNKENTVNIAHNFLIMMIWLLLLGALLYITYKKAINKCTVQGG